MSIEPSGTRDFESKEAEILDLTKKTFQLAYPIYWSGLRILKDAVDLLIKEYAASPDTEKPKYKLVLLMLVNRAIQHLESMRLLVERGLYGDAFVLTRSVMSDLSMVSYLSFHPELHDLFLKESEKDYQENKAFKKAFNEGEIERELTKKGMQTADNAFRILSKTSHASAFGSQLFGYRPSRGNKYHFNYGPKFDAEKGLLLMFVIASGHYDFIVQILAHIEGLENGILPPEWNGVAARTLELESQVQIFNTSVEKTLKDLYKTP